eukprot:15330002-Ditylum_brightwellii.AAC.1
MAKRALCIDQKGGQDKPHPTCVMNNQMAWDIIHHMCKNHPDSMVIVKPYQRKKDGRVTVTKADLGLQKYKGVDERSKIRIPSKNIETDTVDTVKAEILGDPPNATKLWFLYQPLQIIHKPVKEHEEEHYQCCLCHHHYCKEKA